MAKWFGFHNNRANGILQNDNDYYRCFFMAENRIVKFGSLGRVVFTIIV